MFHFSVLLVYIFVCVEFVRQSKCNNVLCDSPKYTIEVHQYQHTSLCPLLNVKI